MNHSADFRLERNMYIKQLLTIEERIQELTEIYLSSTPYNDRRRDFFSNYVNAVEAFLDKDSSKLDFSKVLIGTKVTIFYENENEDEDEDEDFIICFPEKSNPEDGCISFLSPVGRQLLLRTIGDRISLNTPSGEVPVKIKEIVSAMNIVENTK